MKLIVFCVVFALTCGIFDDVHGQRAALLPELLDKFREAPDFLEQLEIAQQIVELGNDGALSALEECLHHEDRHIRGNAAYVFAKFGDVRGLRTLFEILDDRSDRPFGQGIPGVVLGPHTSADRWWVPSRT